MDPIALIGDSIFDNAPYVDRGDELQVHLRKLLPDEYDIVFEAVDGSVLSDVFRQLVALPKDISHAFLSCGGNDALGNLGLLEDPFMDFRSGLERLNRVRIDFLHEYRSLIESLVQTGAEVTVCTIYDPHFEKEHMDDLQEPAEAALCVFNDSITRVATEAGIRVLDLRLICDDPDDFANPIEPSGEGGEKIARAIVDVVNGRMDHRSQGVLIR